MSIQNLFDAVSKGIAFLDDSDIAELQTLRSQLCELREASEAEGLEGLCTACDRGLGAIDALILATAGAGGDTDEWLEVLNAIATYASQVLDALDLGQAVDTIPLPTSGGEAGEDASEDVGPDLDPEMIAMFVGSTNDNLADLEESLLELENGTGDAAEHLSQAKRSLHTIKGECGVIPLPKAQNLCHAAEDLVDRFVEEGAPLPIPLLLEVGDWLGGYCQQLSDGDWATVPAFDALLERLQSSQAGAPAAPEPVAEPEAAAPVAEPEAPVAEPEPVAEQAAPVDEIVDDGARIVFPDEIMEDDVLPDFIGEAREHIEASEAALLDLEHEPDNIELINAIFRAFHTIKGVAGYLNLEPMVELAHIAETLMDQLRKGEIQCGKVHLDLIFASCDVMSALVGALEGNEGPFVAAHKRLVVALKHEIEGGSGAAPETDFSEVGTMADEQPRTKRRLLEILIDQGLISEKMAEVLLDRQAKMPNAKLIGEIAIDTGLVTSENIEEALAIQAQEEGEPAGAAPQPEPAAPVAEQPASEPESAPEPTPEPAVELAPAPQPKAAAPAAPAPTPAAQPSTPKMSEQPTPPAAARAAADTTTASRKPRVASTIKVNTGRLDSLVDLVGELVIAQQMIYQDPDLESIASERLTRNLSQVAKITRDMHEAAMSLRMVTLKPTFQKMARLVRDVSVKAGKEVDLVLTGEDTELDRNVVEEISDPMVHLIRNAIDHGLETPEARKAAGKNPTGRVELRAFHQGGSIVIEIIDDGAGLSRDKILAKAAEKGLLPKDQDPSEMPDSQVWDLIFQPGFSTAAVVSDISGRGVGMDVVRRNIEKMRGKVEITSKFGKGSVFSLRLPLTLAIIDGMVVRVGAQRYVLPTLSIEQSFRPTDDQLHGVMNEGEVVKVREMLLPIHRLRDLFDQEDGEVDAEQGILIVLEDNGERACLMVDEILGQQQVVIKSLGQAGQVLRGISGGAILGDGRIALIVDVDGLVTRTSQVAA